MAVAGEVEEDRLLLAGLVRCPGRQERAVDACAASGAGMIPSWRANSTADAKTSFWR